MSLLHPWLQAAPVKGVVARQCRDDVSLCQGGEANAARVPRALFQSPGETAQVQRRRCKLRPKKENMMSKHQNCSGQEQHVQEQYRIQTPQQTSTNGLLSQSK